MVRENWIRLQERIHAACGGCGRDPSEIRIVGVTKGVPLPLIEEGLSLGLKEVGENRIQEAKEKLPHLSSGILRHMVGHLQTNKVKEAVGLFDLIHSVDSERVASALNEAAGKMGKAQSVLIEVNISGEPSKFGVSSGSVEEILNRLEALKHLRVEGLMALAPQSKDPEIPRRVFRSLRRLMEGLNAQGFKNLRHLSMGMSQDYPIAIEEGATLLRIGRAIFGSEVPISLGETS